MRSAAVITRITCDSARFVVVVAYLDVVMEGLLGSCILRTVKTRVVPDDVTQLQDVRSIRQVLRASGDF